MDLQRSRGQIKVIKGELPCFSCGCLINDDGNCRSFETIKSSVCAILTEKDKFSEFVLLTQLFLQCLHVPGCIALKKGTCWVSKVVICCIGTFLLFNIV